MLVNEPRSLAFPRRVNAAFSMYSRQTAAIYGERTSLATRKTERPATESNRLAEHIGWKAPRAERRGGKVLPQIADAITRVGELRSASYSSVFAAVL